MLSLTFPMTLFSRTLIFGNVGRSNLKIHDQPFITPAKMKTVQCSVANDVLRAIPVSLPSSAPSGHTARWSRQPEGLAVAPAVGGTFFIIKMMQIFYCTGRVIQIDAVIVFFIFFSSTRTGTLELITCKCNGPTLNTPRNGVFCRLWSISTNLFDDFLIGDLQRFAG